MTGSVASGEICFNEWMYALFEAEPIHPLKHKQRQT